MKRSPGRSFRVLILSAAVLSFGLSSASGDASNAPQSKSKRSRAARVQVGLDVLEAQKFAPLKGKRVGLITNHTGVDANGKTTIELLMKAPGVTLVALFSPEHGLAGRVDDRVASSKDPSTGLPIYSLYGDTRRPTDDMLQGIDALIFDVQDAGVRFYTYTATMGYCMEEAAKRKIAFYVLDRPNPISGDIVEGPMLDQGKTSFVAYFPLPVRYGLTIGELAQLFNEENHIGVELHVIAMKNWHRTYFFESTGSRWIPPSPNLRTTKGTISYPGLEILQGAGVSVGRGTETPFELFGAPWMDGPEIAAALNARHIPGFRFVAQAFIPASGSYAGDKCSGVAVRILDRAAARSMRMGIEIAVLLHKKYPGKFDVAKMETLVGNAETIRKIREGATADEIVSGWTKDVDTFRESRKKYFLYK